MIHTATFKGMNLPQGDKKLKLPGKLDATYEVQVFEELAKVGTGHYFKARIVGGGRLDVTARDKQKAMSLAESFFHERLSEWREL